MFVQGQAGTGTRGDQGRVCFYGVIVGNQGNQLRIGDPLQQALVAPVQCRATVVQQGPIRMAVHLEQHLCIAGVQTHHVARLNCHAVFLHDLVQLLIADIHTGATHMGM